MEGFEIMENSMAEQSRCNKKGGGIRVNAFFRLTDERKNSTSGGKKRIIYYSLRNARSKKSSWIGGVFELPKKTTKRGHFCSAQAFGCSQLSMSSICCIFGLRSFRKNYWPDEVRLWQRSAKGNPGGFFLFLKKDWDHVYGRENAPLLKNLRSSGASHDRTGRRSCYIQTAFFLKQILRQEVDFFLVYCYGG